MMRPKKQTMERLAARLKRKSFPCKIETQKGYGSESDHIIRCGRDVQQPSGLIIEANVIPFERNGKEMIRTTVSIGTQSYMRPLLDRRTVETGLENFDKTTREKFEKKGFRVNARKSGGNFPVTIMGEIEKPVREPFSKTFEDDISDLINDSVRHFNLKG